MPALTKAYLNADRREERAAAEAQRPLEPVEASGVENVIQVTGLTSDVAPVTAAEVVAGEQMTLKVLEPKRMTVPGPIAPDEELSLEEGIAVKVLGCEKSNTGGPFQ